MFPSLLCSHADHNTLAPMIYEYVCYRKYLTCELADRVAKNPLYSLRAFARDLELAPTSLSQVLSGRKNLSQERAIRIAERLELNPPEVEYLSLLVQQDKAKSPKLREMLAEKVASHKPPHDKENLSLEYFRIISDWYHYAIRSLTDLPDADMTPQKVGERLGISRFEAEAAIQRLLDLNLLEKDPKNSSRLRKTKTHVLATTKVPNQAFQKYHRQMLNLAAKSLDTQTASEKLVGSEVLAFSKSQLKEAEVLMEEYFTKMIALASKTKKKTDVYHVGVQVFNLTPERNKS
jgi:uncharacterized protein (TIGR02147 family)